MALEKLAEAGTAPALEWLGRAYIEVGRYDDAAKLCDKLSKVKNGAGPAATLHGTVELLTGRYADAIRRLQAEVKARPKNWEARIRLSEARWRSGTARSALKEADEIADYWQKGALKSATDLVWLGRALHLTQYFHDANDILGQAVDADPKNALANLYWAELFLEKEDEANADPSLKAVLKVNPNQPDALVLEAAIDMSSDNDYPKAAERIKKALAVNPNFVPAHQEQAHLLMDTEQYVEALVELDKAAVVNPNDAKTIALMAACKLMLEDEAGYAALVKRALAVNPRYAELYHLVAEAAVREHRYADAQDLERKAIKLDPEYWPSYVGLGMAYSWLGDDKKANEYLQKAFEGDKFNVRAFNLTENFYDNQAKSMVWAKMGPFKVRLEKSEAPILKTLLPAFFDEAWESHKKHYGGFTPKQPLHIEIFKSHGTFSIRTTGYPRLGAMGVCFGHVVTAKSPSNGNFNWGMVLWHELAHVWHIQMSNSRVPRWFTEGLAEHETTLRRPEWKREMDAELFRALKAEKLKGVALFNTMFTQAKTLEEIVLAYYYASKVVAFIDKTWGFQAFPKMLTAWGQKKKTAAVFQEVLSIDLAAFDAKMKTYLETDYLKAFASEFIPAEGDAADEVSKSYHRGTEALEKKDWAGAAAAFDYVISAGKDGARLRLLRAMAASAAKDWTAARDNLRRALEIDPQNARAHDLLRKALHELKDSDGEYAAMKAASLLDEASLDLLMEIAAEARLRHAKDDLRIVAERAMMIAPFSAGVRVLSGEAKLAAGDAKGAFAEAEAAAALAESPEFAAKLLKARALGQLGKKSEALAILDSLGDRPEVQAARDEIK